MEFKQTKLDNGLTIIAEINENARSTAAGFFVRTGGRDENSEISGVSHYLEHMMFKGTEKRSAMEVNLEFDQMGAKYNAFTSEENTVYYAAVLPEYQRRAIDLWADLLRPALRDDDFNTEKGVILEEIAMYQDLPHFDVLDRCRKLHFAEHSCGNSVLGSIESIKALSSGQMRDYFDARYSPDNMALVAAGKVNYEDLIAQATELCSSWQSKSPARNISESSGSGKSRTISKDNVIRQHLCIMTAAPSAQDKMRYSANVLANVIGDVTNSRLYWALVDNALADSADMEYDPMDGAGAFYTYISCDPSKTDEVLEIVRNVFTKVREEGITDPEMMASKNKIASGMTLNGELPMGRLVPLGYNWIYRQQYKSLADELLAIDAVGHFDLHDLLARYQLEKLSILGLGPPENIPA